jgi:membrane protein required for colicin V production
MEGFTVIDGIVAAVIVLSALLAYGRGLVRETLAIAGWVIAAIVGYLFAPRVEPLIRELPVVGEFLGTQCNEISIVFAFALVLVAGLILFSLFTPLFSGLIQRSVLGGIDQALGFLFGVARGLLLVAIAFFLYDTVITGQEFTMVDESRSAAVFGRFTGQIEDQDPQAAMEWFRGQFNGLLDACQI